MTEADVLYRALGELYKDLSADVPTSKLMDLIAKAPNPESVTVTHNICRVETDWITEIEHGLVFVGRALDENRQFIRSDGEVKPIEKVKHVSKESVQHLSKHSDLITREQKDDIVPDKLFTVEKESDYAVYENRFLYLLLTRIHDFVSVRYEAIAGAYKEYRGEYEVSKTVKAQNRNLKFSFKFTDEQEDVVLASADDECAAAITRMDNILESVAFYLRTPIMIEVSKTDKISGNITKTNVLLMNKNFAAAMKLYEYLNAFDRDGYSIEKCVDNPAFPDAVKRELAIPAMLAAFIVYEHGLGLEKYLKSEREKEDLRRAEEEQKEIQKRLKALKKRLERTGEGVDEYILNLERRNEILENSYKLLQTALKDIEELKVVISRLNSEIEVLEKEIEALNDEKQKLIEEMARKEEEHKKELEATVTRYEEQIAATLAAHLEEIASLKAECEQKLASLKEECENALAEEKRRAQERYDKLKLESEKRLSDLKEAHAVELEKLRAEHKSKLESLDKGRKAELEKVKRDFEARISNLTSQIGEKSKAVITTSNELSKIKDELRLTMRERDVLKARITAIKKEHGLLTKEDVFTTEEGFDELEHEFEVLGKLLSDEWKGVKAMLRSEILGGKRSSSRKKKAGKEYLELRDFVNSQAQDDIDEQNSDNDNRNAEVKAEQNSSDIDEQSNGEINEHKADESSDFSQGEGKNEQVPDKGDED